MIQVPARHWSASQPSKQEHIPELAQARRAVLLSIGGWTRLYVAQVGKIIEDIAGFFLGVKTHGKEPWEHYTHHLKAACRTIYKALFKSVNRAHHSHVWLDAVEYGAPRKYLKLWLIGEH